VQIGATASPTDSLAVISAATTGEATEGVAGCIVIDDDGDSVVTEHEAGLALCMRWTQQAG
jgi:hypothetical protein